MIWKLKFIILILFLLSITAVSQTVKIDEFGDSIKNECDRTARLDQLAIALQNDPSSTGQVIIYLGADEPFSKQSESSYQHYKLMVKTYLERSRGIDPSRLSYVNGGFRPKITTELWIIPERGELPKPTNVVSKPIVPTDKISIYNKTYLFAPYEDSEPYDFLLASVKAEYDKTQKEWEAEFGNEETKDIESPKISKKEKEDLELFWAESNYGKIIKNQPDSKGVIIFYLDDTRLDIKKVRKNLEKGRRRIAKESGISANKIEIIYGGYRDWVQADMWIVPKNIDKPKLTPEKREEAKTEN